MRWQRLESLEKLGWAVRRNLAIEYRLGVNDLEDARSAIAQILRLTPDMILADGGPALTAAQQATHTMPIVFMEVSEPVERGFVASLLVRAATPPVSRIWKRPWAGNGLNRSRKLRRA